MFLLRCRHQSDFELFDTDYQSVSYGGSTVFSLCLEMPNMELYVLYIYMYFPVDKLFNFVCSLVLEKFETDCILYDYPKVLKY